MIIPKDFFTSCPDVNFNGPIGDMNGPASSIAFESRLKGWLLFPLAVTGSNFYYKLEAKTASKFAKKYKSLAWALRAWAHYNRKGFTYNADGTQLSIPNIIEDVYFDNDRNYYNYLANEKPQIYVATLTSKGWCLNVQNAIKESIDTLNSLNVTPGEGFALMGEGDDNIDILFLPVINYDGDIVEQVQTCIDNLDAAVNSVIKQLNSIKK